MRTKRLIPISVRDFSQKTRQIADHSMIMSSAVAEHTCHVREHPVADHKPSRTAHVNRQFHVLTILISRHGTNFSSFQSPLSTFLTPLFTSLLSTCTFCPRLTISLIVMVLLIAAPTPQMTTSLLFDRMGLMMSIICEIRVDRVTSIMRSIRGSMNGAGDGKAGAGLGAMRCRCRTRGISESKHHQAYSPLPFHFYHRLTTRLQRLDYNGYE